MPELPEVETVARSLSPHITNCLITKVSLLHPPSLHPESCSLDGLIGQKIINVNRRGKLLKITLNDVSQSKTNNPLFLLFHLRMTGKLLIGDPSLAPGKHCRCVFTLHETSGRVFNLLFEDMRTFGKILAATPESLEQWQFWRKLGPEPLEMAPNDLGRRLKGSRPIKNALLDQEVIAGIGNIYADEALFQAGICPLRGSNSLTGQESSTLLRSIQEILKKAIDKGGSSIRDYVDANGNIGHFQNTFKVYGRGGKECVKCGAPLHKVRIGGRSTVFCEHCQK